MSDIPQNAPHRTDAEPRPHLLSPAVFGVGAFAADALLVLFASVITGVAYHLAAYGQPGDVFLFARGGLLTALFFTLPYLLREKYRLTSFIADNEPLPHLFLNWNFAFLSLLALGFLSKSTDLFSRGSLLLFYFAGFLALAAMRHVLTKQVRLGCQSGRIAARRVMLVGAKERINAFLQTHKPERLGLRVCHQVVLDDYVSRHYMLTNPGGLERLLETAANRLREEPVNDVILLMPWSSGELIDRCVNRFMTRSVSIHLGPQPIFDRFIDAHLTRLGSMNTLNLVHPPLSAMEVALKRAMDIIGASLGLLVLSPVLALFAVLIRLDSPGPALFRQQRYGFNQRPFNILKFRSMTAMEDGARVTQATQNDPRVTRMGRFMRKWNIDELPQLINVLKGDMSLVGPRPHALAHDHEFARKIARYARRMNVRPGITGFAQVNGFRGPTDTDEKIQNRVDCDLYYIDNWSLWLDLNIILMTLFSQKAYKNAY